MTTIGPPSVITMITYLNICIVKENKRTGVRVQWLGALAALPYDPGLVPGTLMAAYHHLYLQSLGTWCPLLPSAGSRQTCGVQTYMGKSTHINKVEKLKLKRKRKRSTEGRSTWQPEALRLTDMALSPSKLPTAVVYWSLVPSSVSESIFRATENYRKRL